MIRKEPIIYTSILEAFQLVIPIFAIIFLGWGLRKIRIADTHWVRVLNDLAFYVTLPVLTFNSLAQIDTSLLDAKLILSNVAVLVVAIGVTLLVSFLARASRAKSGTILIATLFGNVAYLGYPISEAAFGAPGLEMATILAPVHVLVYFTIVVVIAEYVANKGLDARTVALRIVKIPLVWAVVLGILAAFLRITLPSIVSSSLGTLSGAATAVALLALGVFLSDLCLEGQILAIALVTGLKLAILPLVAWIVFAFSGLDGLPAAVSILQAAMPVGLSTFALADRMHMDKELAASTILVTTVLAVLTLSVILALIR